MSLPSPSSRTAPLKVIWMDDDSDVIKRAKGAFDDDDRFVLHAFESPTIGISMTTNILPDILVLDIAMPLLDGGSVMNIIHSRKGLEDIPVIFQTSLLGSDEVGEKGYTVNAGNFMVPKPVDMKLIKDLITRRLAA